MISLVSTQKLVLNPSHPNLQQNKADLAAHPEQLVMHCKGQFTLQSSLRSAVERDPVFSPPAGTNQLQCHCS